MDTHSVPNRDPNRRLPNDPPLKFSPIFPRARGVGKNLLTFSSDGTFFRSGDAHPVYSGGHGAWKRVGEREFEASYIAFTFDQNGKWDGSNMVRIRIIQGPGDNEFTATTKTSRRDLQDKEISVAQGRLTGRRIQVEPF